MKRGTLLVLADLAVHGALVLGIILYDLYVSDLVPVTIAFERGRAAVELQASIAAAPREEEEPTPTVEVEPETTVEETRPPELQAANTAVERRPAAPPDPTKADAVEQQPDEALVEVAMAPASRAEPKQPADEARSKPPARTQTDAEPRELEAPQESVAQNASQHEVGVEVEEQPRPHTTNRQPPYPRDAYVRGQQGTVVLHLLITTAGTVDDVRIAQSSGVPSLDAAAIDAARNWRYTPARRGGMSVAMTFAAHVNFQIRALRG